MIGVDGRDCWTLSEIGPKDGLKRLCRIPGRKWIGISAHAPSSLVPNARPYGLPQF